MNLKMLPTELWLLELTNARVSTLRPVTSLDIYEGASANFHDDGLYSTLIFGRVGTEDRDLSFSYIDIKVQILHPKVYKDVCALKGLYKGILSGKETARWDKDLSDFVADRSPEAQTGYSFFINHFKSIVFKRNKSPARTQRVEFVEKYRDKAMMSRIAVIPAGMRDVEVDNNGRTTRHEVNDLYYKALSIANTITVTDNMNDPQLDQSRLALTNTMVEIYTMLEDMVAGKKGFMLNKWGSRRITHGTRNVLTVMDTSSDMLGADNAPDYASTVIGLYQTVKALTPLTMHLLRTRYLDSIFADGDASIPLIDKKSLRQEFVSISPESRDMWTTKEGLLQVINQLVNVEARHRPVEIEGRYLALVYKGPNKTFKVFYDIRELPPEFDKKHVTPITLAELVYLSGYDRWNKYFLSVTRYPVTGVDSNYPSKIYVKTTTIGEVRHELDNRWQVMGDDHVALEFPRSDIASFVDAMSPHSSRLVGLGADFDGDTGSGTALMTDEALEESNRFLGTRQAWVSADGRLRASATYDTIEMVVLNMTGRYDYGSNVAVPTVL